MSSIFPNTLPEPVTPEIDGQQGAPRPRVGESWSFLKTLFVGITVLTVLVVIGTLAASAWLTANQRAEAEYGMPWVNPSFTTTAVTTGGLLSRWMDADGNLDNGHTYIQGIYNLWKTRHIGGWAGISASNTLGMVPPLWRLEFMRDLDLASPVARDVAREMVDDAKKDYAREMLDKAKENGRNQDSGIKADNVQK